MNNNPILALVENNTPETFVEDVANAYFANPVHVRKLLNADCIEECVNYVLGNQRVEFDLSDLNLFNEEEVLFSKPSRQRGKREHDKKEHKRKGNAKRSRDRSRKHAHGEHICKVYDRGLVGDWGRRGRRLAKTGEVSLKTNHRVKTNCADFIPDDNGTNDVTMTFGDVSMTMNQFNWKDYEEQWDAFCNSYAFHELLEQGDGTLWDEYWDKVCQEEEEDLKNGRDLKTNLDKDLDSFDDEILVICSDDDDDEIIDEPAPTPNKKSSYDTSKFTAMELAQMSMKLACANPDQRAWIRKFMETL